MTPRGAATTTTPATETAATTTPPHVPTRQTPNTPPHESLRARQHAPLPPVEEKEAERERYHRSDESDRDLKTKEGTGTDSDDVSPHTPIKPLPAYPAEGWGAANVARMPDLSESRGRRSRHSTVRRQSALDWIVPHGEELNIALNGVGPTKVPREKTVGDRLDPTLVKAQIAREKFSFHAKLTGYALNGAIGLQVVLGALTTGLSVVTTGKQTSIMTAILGGFSTIVASYLAKARGSNEPENSLLKVKDLDQFIRDCEAFKLDCGHVSGDKHDAEISRFRERFEELLGNINPEKHTTPPA